MRVNAETLQIRISKLRQLVAECPAPGNVQEEIKEILEVAPDMLKIAEDGLQLNDPLVFNQVHEGLRKMEIDIEWAVGTVKGVKTVRSIEEGTDTNPDLPAKERLNNRLLKFMLTQIDKDTYLELFEEFGGKIDGDTAYMDPGEETEAFSQWIIHDKKIPGMADVIIKVFAQKEMNNLPSDEQSLLKAYLKDWPSIFQVIKISKKKNIYWVKDLLSDQEFKLRDKASSKTLIKGSIFIGRTIPFNVGDLCYPLGKILELPPKLWKVLSDFLNEWSKEFFAAQPGTTSQDFYRYCNARMRRKIIEITGVNQDNLDKDIQQDGIDPQKIKIASEINSYVKKFKKNSKNIDEIIGSPKIMHYMTMFKGLMDACTKGELDSLTVMFDGFYEFSLVLENFASAIKDGAFDDQL